MSSVCADQEEVGDDPFASDEFRMYEFKVRRCLRSRSHDWTDCPFAHPGEKARRRDPRKFHYSGTACADFRRAGGSCPRGDACEFAHGVFECWLHPARYRTHACKDGKRCKRKVCFFAHSPQELRVFLPFSTTTSSCCCSSCVFCGSPTSTLSSRTFSPPTSPTSTNYNLLSRFNEETKNVKLPQLMSYKSALMELARSLKAMEITTTYGRKQFVLSSSTGINKGCSEGPREIFSADHQDAVMGNNGGGQFPDLEWVNELVM